MSDTALRRTPLHDRHVRAGGRIVPFAGWEMPVQYKGIVDEHQAVRTACGVFDVSHMGELELSGEYAAQVVDYLITNDASKLVDGQALYTCACKEDGGILDDLIIYRAAQDRWMIVCNASNHEKMAAHFKKAAENHCEFKDRSDETALIALQGPKAFEVLDRAGADAAKLRELKSFHFRDAVVANIRCTVARTGYTGEDGVEIFCAWNDAPALWDQLMELGSSLGIKPAGLGARDTLRLEAGLCLYGHDLNARTTPVHAGLTWAIQKVRRAGGEREGGYPGAKVIDAQLATGVPHKRVGLLGLEHVPVREGAQISDTQGRRIGVVTSGTLGPTVGKPIAMAYLATNHTQLNHEVYADVREQKVPMRVQAMPFTPHRYFRG